MPNDNRKKYVIEQFIFLKPIFFQALSAKVLGILPSLV